MMPFMRLEIFKVIALCLTIVVMTGLSVEDSQDSDETLFVCETGMDCLEHEE